MKTQKRIIWFVIPLMAAFWANSANASSVTVIGATVADGGSTGLVGIPAGPDGTVKYFIPINESDMGTYGDSSTCEYGIGTCSDSGMGFGYDYASALKMNIYFDLSSQTQSITSAQLDFNFVDLDLNDVNDPNGFFESMSLSYWDWNDPDFELVSLSGAIKNTSELFGSSTSSGKNDPITWSLNLESLGILDALNDSQTNHQGFWIQLGFGSTYTGTGSNTPEYLTAELTVAPVPVPAAIWLFGTALIGFVGMSRRTAVT